MILPLLWGFLLGTAAGNEPDPVGLPIAEVALSAPQGGLPEESLAALLRARQGDPYSRQAVRLDLATLFRVGAFSAVEAHTDPWVAYDPETGEPTEAVLLTYVLYPAPRVERIRVQGNDRVKTRELLAAAGLTSDQVFYPDLDVPRVQQRVLAWIRRKGFVQAQVEIDPIPLGPGRFEVWIRVFEGRPNTLTRMAFIGQLPPSISERTLRRWARSEGLVEGRPISQEAIGRASVGLKRRLGRVTAGLVNPRRGWISARVNPAVSRTDDGEVTLTWAVEAGPRLDLAVTGLPWRAKKQIRDALGIDERLRLTRGFLEEAPERLTDYLQRRGYLGATVAVELEGDSTDPVQTLRVDVARGATHTLRGAPPRRSVLFEGNTAISQADLVRVVDQASVDVIRLDYFTEAELKIGLAAAANLYRSQGYQEAQLELKDLRIKRRGPLATLSGFFAGRPPPKHVIPTIQVVEGPLTRQRQAVIAGAAQGVDLSDLEAELVSRAGEPFSPNALDRVARQVVRRHRDAGYLEVDARVRHDEAARGEVISIIEVSPGPMILLRSVVTSGAVVTRPWFIRREVELTLGAPLTSADLERARRALYNAGVFATVSTQLIGDETARDLLIKVVERKRWAWEAGVGLNTDQGLRTFGRITRRNLFGLAHRVDALALIGLDYASDSITNWTPDLSNVEFRAAISYTAPHFPFRRQDAVADMLIRERRQELTWRMARTGFGGTVNMNLGPDTQLQASARLERRELQELDRRALIGGEPWDKLFADEANPDRPRCFPCRIQEVGRLVLLHDLRDDPVQPTSGMLLSANSEWVPGVRWDTASAPYIKAEARLSGFVPLGGLLLRLTGEAGHVAATSEGIVPLEDRFRMGGTGSMRGFTRQSLGPRNRAERVDVKWPRGIAPVVNLTEREDLNRWIPTGGDTQARAIVEMILPLPTVGLSQWDGYAAALFADVGNAWMLDPDANVATRGRPDVPLIRYGLGVGLRVETPVGPLAFDAASNPLAMFGDGPQNALVTEEWEEPRTRAHLSLGTLW